MVYHYQTIGNLELFDSVNNNTSDRTYLTYYDNKKMNNTKN